MDEMLRGLGVNLNGLKYEELNNQELDTLHQWLDSLQKNEMTLEKIKEYVHQLRDNIEQEFTKTGLSKEQDIFLKARLRNIMLLESFLLSPERAKKALELAVKGVSK